MKEQFTTDVINLKSYSISEADKIIVMYSREKGIIKGIAKGIKKPANRLGGRMDLFVANKMMLNKGRNLNTICQAEALNTFLNLRTDINKLFFAMYCSEIVSNFGVENDPNSREIYELFYKLLDGLSKSHAIVKSMLAVIKFQLKIMDITGYSVELEKCVKCLKPVNDDIYFSAGQGGVLCIGCASETAKKVKIHNKIREFLNTLLKEDFDMITKYDELADEKVCSSCLNLLKNYIEYYSPKRFKTAQILENIS